MILWYHSSYQVELSIENDTEDDSSMKLKTRSTFYKSLSSKNTAFPQSEYADGRRELTSFLKI